MTSGFPLSPGQQRLWYLHELEGTGCTISDYKIVRITGALDVKALSVTLDRLVARHEPLRTSFVDLMQTVRPTATLTLDVVDVASIEEALGRARERFAVPFDPARPPLMRLTLFRLAEQDFVLLLYLHMLIGDAWAVEVFCRDLSAIYREEVTGVPARLPELAIQPVDWVVWRADRRAERLAELTDWWRGQLRDVPPLLTLPVRAAHARSVAPARRIVREITVLRERLAAFAAAERSSVYVVLLAAYARLLSVHSGQNTFVLLTPAANRDEPETQDIMGFLVEVLALRIELTAEPDFRETMAAVRAAWLAAYEHRELPLQDLISLVDGARVPGRAPLAQAGIAHRPAGSLGTLDLTGCATADLRLDADRAKFELTFRVNEDDNATYVCAEFDGDLFDPAYVDQLVDEYVRMLAELTPSPHEAAVAVAVAEVLGAPIGRDEDFFAAGGGSVDLLRLLFRLRAEFGDGITLAALRDSPTVAAMAREIQ